MLSAFIMGLAGLELAPGEISLLRSARPCGVILFARNVATPDQVRRLTGAAADAVGDEILVLIDQEGGPTTRPAAVTSIARRRPRGRSRD
jgi:beta-N-acetylhexosaminidase